MRRDRKTRVMIEDRQFVVVRAPQAVSSNGAMSIGGGFVTVVVAVTGHVQGR